MANDIHNEGRNTQDDLWFIISEIAYDNISGGEYEFDKWQFIEDCKSKYILDSNKETVDS